MSGVDRDRGASDLVGENLRRHEFSELRRRLEPVLDSPVARVVEFVPLRDGEIVASPHSDPVFSLDDMIGIAAARLAGELRGVRFRVGDLHLERRIAARTIRFHLPSLSASAASSLRLVPLGASRSSRSVLFRLHDAWKRGSPRSRSSRVEIASCRDLGRDQRPLHGVDDFDRAPRRQHPVLSVEGHRVERTLLVGGEPAARCPSARRALRGVSIIDSRSRARPARGTGT